MGSGLEVWCRQQRIYRLVLRRTLVGPVTQLIKNLSRKYSPILGQSGYNLSVAAPGPFVYLGYPEPVPVLCSGFSVFPFCKSLNCLLNSLFSPFKLPLWH